MDKKSKDELDAWKSEFTICQGNSGHWLVVEKDKFFSYNCILYKTKSGATKGARAAYSKLNREFENILFVNE